MSITNEMQAGDKITIQKKQHNKGIITREYIFLSETEKFMTISNGKYRSTINKSDIKKPGDALKGEDILIIKGEKEMKYGIKINEKQLIDEVKKHGSSKEAKEIMAKKYNVGYHSLDCKISNFRKLGKFKGFDGAKDTEPNEIKEIEKPIPIIESQSKENVTEPMVNTDMVESALEEVEQVEEIFAETNKNPEPKAVIFTPILMKAAIFTYKFDKTGLTIEDSVSDIISTECINEQQEALKMWNQYYGVKNV